MPAGCLCVMCLLQVYALFMILGECREMVGLRKREALLRLSVVIASATGITFLLLLWSLFRWFRQVRQPRLPRSRLDYVDAWTEAGRRIDVDETDEGEG